MRRLLWRGAPIADAAGTPLTRALAAGGAVVVLLAGGTAMAYPPVPTRPVASSIGSSAGRNGMAYRQIILPDLLVVAPKGLSAAQISRIGKVSGVRNVITADGAAIKMGTHQVNVLGVDPQQFRSWTPLATASDQSLWTALASGRFVASQDAAARPARRPELRADRGGPAEPGLRRLGTPRRVRHRRAGQQARVRLARPGPQCGRADQRPRRCAGRADPWRARRGRAGGYHREPAQPAASGAAGRPGRQARQLPAVVPA